MSARYLGERFDIHGGGMDLVFPHHEAEIAQGTAACGHAAARYWMHNNMVTLSGQKMGKSLGNAISLEQFFTGDHPLLERAYSPMTIRFFMLQAHYRSTLDFSNEALQAAEKGLDRLMKAVEVLDKLNTNWPGQDSILVAGSQETVDVDYIDKRTGKPFLNYQSEPCPDPALLETRLREAMDDDLSSPLVIATLFDWVRVIHQLHDLVLHISEENLAALKHIFHTWVFDILGLRDEKSTAGKDHLAPVMDLVLELRKGAKAEKNWALSDKIRDGLAAAGIKVMDKKDGTSEWQVGGPSADLATQKK
jgi:cysteinyl-tRNA synthetase